MLFYLCYGSVCTFLKQKRIDWPWKNGIRLKSTNLLLHPTTPNNLAFSYIPGCKVHNRPQRVLMWQDNLRFYRYASSAAMHWSITATSIHQTNAKCTTVWTHPPKPLSSKETMWPPYYVKRLGKWVCRCMRQHIKQVLLIFFHALMLNLRLIYFLSLHSPSL